MKTSENYCKCFHLNTCFKLRISVLEDILRVFECVTFEPNYVLILF